MYTCLLRKTKVCPDATPLGMVLITSDFLADLASSNLLPFTLLDPRTLEDKYATIECCANFPAPVLLAAQFLPCHANFNRSQTTLIPAYIP